MLVHLTRIAAWMAAVLATIATTAAQTVAKPDVYLVTIDTLRADHLHCYGDTRIQTPTLDSLAHDGVRFAQAFTPSPITNTSHTSILTGLLPSVHGVTDFGMPLATTHATWAELLKKDGYRTAAFIGAVVLDSRSLAPGLDRGFDYYDNFPAAVSKEKHWGRVERRGADVMRRSEAWMTANTAGPRFVWIHLYDPHDPYEPPAPYSQIYKGRLYDGEVAYADSALGGLVVYLKQHHRYRNALIIVVGDHGEGLGEHGEETHGIFLYNSTTHVPLLIKLPDTEPAKRVSNEDGDKVVSAEVQTIDILPTVLDLLSIPGPTNFSGRSLTSYFAGGAEAQRPSFAETDYPLRYGWAPLRAVRSGGFKFIEAPKPELYNMGSDPSELKNEYEPWSTTVQQLRKDLASSGMRPPAPSQVAGTAGGDTLNELRALGYLGPGDERTSTDVPELSSLPDPKDRIEQQNLLHSAMMLMDEKRSIEARPLLEKVLTLDAESAAALRQLGELELNAGRYRKSADYFRRVRKILPDDAMIAFEEGQALDKLGEWKGAGDSLESSLKRSPAQLRARVLLGQVYLKLGDHASAEDQFEAALLLNPASQLKATASAKDFHLLAETYRGLGRKVEAEKALLRAKAMDAEYSNKSTVAVKYPPAK